VPKTTRYTPPKCTHEEFEKIVLPPIDYVLRVPKCAMVSTANGPKTSNWRLGVGGSTSQSGTLFRYLLHEGTASSTVRRIASNNCAAILIELMIIRKNYLSKGSGYIMSPSRRKKPKFHRIFLHQVPSIPHYRV
jgi:hypothetical protein